MLCSIRNNYSVSMREGRVFWMREGRVFWSKAESAGVGQEGCQILILGEETNSQISGNC